MFTELQAAMGLAQLEKLKRIINLKLQIYQKYKNAINSIKSIKFIKATNNSNQIHWFTNILCENRKLVSYLKKKQIQTRRAFLPLHLQPCYKNNENIISKKKYSNSIEVYKKLISLPSACQLKNKDLNYIISHIKLFFKKND